MVVSPRTRCAPCHLAPDAGSRKVNLTGNLVGVTRCRIQVRHDRSAQPSGLWEKAERKIAERDERGKKMFEPGRINRSARGSKACRTAAAKRARRVLFPRTSQPFFSFRTSAGSFLLAFPFLLREKKREILDARAVRPYWPGRYCRLFSLGINSGYILDTTSRTVSARTAMRGPGKRILRVNLPVFSGSRVGVRDDLCRYS